MPIILDCAQRSREWHIARLGRLTASTIRRLLAGHHTWDALLEEIALEREVRDGIDAGAEWAPPADPQSGPLAHGIYWEPHARAIYALLHDVDVTDIGFAIHDDLDILGASPDGVVAGQPGGIEVKCPYNMEVHAETVFYGMPAHHRAQVQTQIAVMDWAWVDFISYCPEYPDPDKRLVVYRQARDDAYIQDLLAAVRAFQARLDGTLPAADTTDAIPTLF